MIASARSQALEIVEIIDLGDPQVILR